MLAIRPFYSRERSVDKRRGVVDLLWPLGTFSQRGERSNWRLLLAFGTGNESELDNEAYRFRLFPIYFEGRTRAGDEYRALFPVYGEIRDFLGFGDTKFCLFPIYGSAVKGQTETRTLLWPFYLTRHGPKIEQLRLWPFYGRRVTSGAMAHSRTFVLWPIWHRLSYDNDSIQGSATLLWPLYGRSHFERAHRGTERGWSLLPPLIGLTRGDDGYRSLRAPWPFIRQLDSDKRRERHWWPLYGTKQSEISRSWYAAWPFVGGMTVSNKISISKQFRVTPFYLQEQRTFTAAAGTAEPPVVEQYRRLWPLFSWQRTKAGSRLRVPELSLFHHSEPIERNWAPLWSLFVKRDRSDGAYVTDILWGLAAWGRDAEARRFTQVLWVFNFKGRAAKPAGESLP